MRKNIAERSARTGKWMLFVLTALLLLIFLGLVNTVAGGSQCEARVSIAGQLLDAEGAPVAGETVLFSFFVNVDKRDVEVRRVTDAEGQFFLEAKVPQKAYENSGYHCVEIQARLLLPNIVEEVAFAPGSLRLMSEQGAYETWAGPGVYEEGEIPLFRNLRVAADADALRAFADLEVQLGSLAEPCLIQLAGANTGEEQIEIKVNHLYAATEESAAAAETYYYTAADPQGQWLYPPEIAGMAPLKVAQEGIVMVEAQRGSPITKYQVQGLNEQLHTGITDPGGARRIQVSFYYDMDRDGDGVPDHQVTERYVTAKGQALADQPTRTTIHAHQDHYRGSPPEVSGYRYLGYQRNGDGLLSGQPEERLTEDVTYQFVYEKKRDGSGGSGNGSGGGGTDETDPKLPPDEEEAETRPAIPDPEPKPGETDEADRNQEVGEPEPPDPLDPPSVAGESDSADASGNRNVTAMGAGTNSVTERVHLTQEKREALRNVTFVKMSYRQEAQPGEEVTYGFRGFENEFPYPLQRFTIVDEPEPGLDLVSIELPAFQEGEGVSYDITYSTNQREKWLLKSDLPANEAVTIAGPRLSEEEYITKISILFGDVPAGFGKDDEIRITFRIWAEPPQEEVHNLGFLYYEEQGEVVERRSTQGDLQVSIGDGQPHASQSKPNGEMAQNNFRQVNGESRTIIKTILKVCFVIFLLVGLLWAVNRRMRQDVSHR